MTRAIDRIHIGLNANDFKTRRKRFVNFELRTVDREKPVDGFVRGGGHASSDADRRVTVAVESAV